MPNRIQLSTGASEPYQHLLGLHRMVEKAAADAGLDQRLLELVKIRASMLNGCAFCLDMHARDARRLAETKDVSDEVYDEATRVSTEDQYQVVAWAITVINAFNRLAVTSRKALPNPTPAASGQDRGLTPRVTAWINGLVGWVARGYCPGVSSWGHVEVAHVSHVLPDGRTLLDDVSFRIGEGTTAALVGPNGAGKTTLLRLVAGDLQPQEGSVTSTGGLGVMRQFIGTDHSQGITPMVRDLLLSVAPPQVREAAARLDAAELAMMERDDERAQLRYAAALAEWGEAGGYEAEVHWDACTVAAFGIPYDQCRWRDVGTLSGGEQKRLVLESLLRGNDGVLLLDEPDNYLDVPGKRWLEQQLASTPKTVLLVSHDRELLAACAQRIVTVEDRHVWVHGGGFGNYAQARADRISRLEELRRRWDEEHEKLKELVHTLRQKASYNDGMASRYQAAVTRLRRFEDEGPPQEAPREQNVTMRLRGGRTGKRAVMCENLVLTGNTNSFGTEIWFDDRVAILGANGSGKSSFLRLLAGEEVPHEGRARLGARVVPGMFAQTHTRPDLAGRTPVELLMTEHALLINEAMSALSRYELSSCARQPFGTLSGGQQARLQILLLELAGSTLLLLDEPTDNLDLPSAEALQQGLESYQGTVLAVTHDRWFARSFERFLIFTPDGNVREATEPAWD